MAFLDNSPNVDFFRFSPKFMSSIILKVSAESFFLLFEGGMRKKPAYVEVKK
jgi:hypothetical protein